MQSQFSVKKTVWEREQKWKKWYKYISAFVFGIKPETINKDKVREAEGKLYLYGKLVGAM